MTAWIDYFVETSLPLFAMLSLFEGARRLFLGDQRRNAVQVLATGALLVLVVSGNAYYKHQLVNRIQDTLNSSAFSKYFPLQDSWGGACCTATRASESRSLAESAFIESGKLYEHFDSNGRRVLLTPSEAEIAKRAEHVLSDYRIAEISHQRLSEAIGMLVSAIICLVVGAIVGKAQRKVA